MVRKLQINNVECLETFDERVPENKFRHFKECTTSLEDKSVMRPSVAGNEDMLEIIEQQPITNAYTLSAELDLSQSH